MKIRLACACGQQLEYGKTWAGKVASCPGCAGQVVIPPLGIAVVRRKEKAAKRLKRNKPVAVGPKVPEPDKASYWPKTSLSLMQQVRDGTASEWETFVNIYSPLVYRYCRHKGLQDVDADTVTWGVMAKVHKFEYNPERGRFHNWLLTVAQREVNHLKKKASVQAGQIGVSFPEEIAVSTADIDWDRLCHTHILHAAMTRIQPEFDGLKWQAFKAVGFRLDESADEKVWVEVENPSYSTVAAEVGKSVEWLYKVKSEMLKRLKEEIQYLAEDLGILT